MLSGLEKTEILGYKMVYFLGSSKAKETREKI
jgi:hypothetical protein